MFIAKNLKQLRLDMGMTQEELAERVGVTGQAVSKWERGECYPDITLLPGLANCFDVTVDELLGMAEIKGKMWGVYARANELQIEGKYYEAAAIMEDALKTFPADLGLAMWRAVTLVMAGEEVSHAIELCERRLEESRLSDHSRGGVVTVLCFLYRSVGMIEKAETLARRLPHWYTGRELVLPHFLAQPEREAYLREHLPGILTGICEMIDGYTGTIEEHLRRTAFGEYKSNASPVEAATRIVEFLTGR